MSLLFLYASLAKAFPHIRVGLLWAQLKYLEFNFNVENSKNAKNVSYASKKIKGQPVVYVSTCGMSVTTDATDGWGFKELMEWAEKIEKNYCAPDAQYSNTSGDY